MLKCDIILEKYREKTDLGYGIKILSNNNKRMHPLFASTWDIIASSLEHKGQYEVYRFVLN